MGRARGSVTTAQILVPAGRRTGQLDRPRRYRVLLTTPRAADRAGISIYHEPHRQGMRHDRCPTRQSRADPSGTPHALPAAQAQQRRISRSAWQPRLPERTGIGDRTAVLGRLGKSLLLTSGRIPGCPRAR